MRLLNGLHISSKFLERKVTYDLVIPPNYSPLKTYFLLVMNDGEDYAKLGMTETLNDFWKGGGSSFVFVGVHCDNNRLAEYGTADVLDFLGRGRKAKKYQRFLMEELVPFLKQEVSLKEKGHSLCGFSLGGLSAIDTVWGEATIFSKVGVFSGALWWRSKDYGKDYNEDRDRIIHQKIKLGNYKVGLQFWFQCGTEDEKADRNKNGVIDSIDDTLDLIKELQAKGYKSGQQVHYEEVDAGEHNQKTWKAIFPSFLSWAFASESLV
ncbi:MAG: enterochelin esterase-like enzyme [Psychromonas sp.]|jgi:enterochelin esterase-like enzyme